MSTSQQCNIKLQNTLFEQNQRLTKQMDDITTSWKQIQAEKTTPPPTFWISVLVAYLLLVVPFITYLYSSILNHQIMILVKENGVLDAMVKVFKTGNFAVNIAGQEQTFRTFWAEVMVTITKTILRGRFFLVVALFVVLLATILFTYSLYYHGENYQAAARMISIALAFILGFTFLFTNNRTMIQPFENVVGYGMVKLFSNSVLRDALGGIFRHKHFKNKYVFPGAALYYDFILNSLTVDNFPTVLEEIYKNNAKYDFEINTDEQTGISTQHVQNLFEIVLSKNTVGHMCWLFFAALAGSMLSFQYILSNEM